MNALRDRQFWQDIGRNAQDAARGAVRGIGTALPGAAVDLVNMAYLPAANALGYGIDPAQVVGSSAWFASQADQRELLPQGDSPSFRGGEFFGPMLAAAAPDSVNMLASGAGKVGNFLADAVGDLSRTPMRNQLGAIAYHGSPHRFDQFDMSKIGTGEGAQAYGHGLYFAESPDVAQSYRTALAPDKKATSLNDRIKNLYVGDRPVMDYGIEMNADFIEAARKGPEDALSHIDERLASWRNLAADPSYPFKDYAQEKAAAFAALRQDAAQKGVAYAGDGALYTVDIPDEAIGKMLDWDAPLSEQPEAVRKAMVKAFPGTYVNGQYIDPVNSQLVGRELLDQLHAIANKRGESGMRTAEKQLQAAGIPGIKYFDGGSRQAGKGTRNYVVFDDKLPKIKSRE